MSLGLKQLIVIPINARHVEMELNSMSLTGFEIRTRSKKSIYLRKTTRNAIIGGTKFQLTDKINNWIQISAFGPILEDLIVSSFTTPNHGIFGLFCFSF